MRPSRVALLVWTLVVIVLVVVEFAELTRLFTVNLVVKVLNDPIALVVSLVFTTIMAVVGAIFVGISITTRLLSPRGFTPFEEEMLKMRADLADVRKQLAELLARDAAPAPDPSRPPEGGAGR